jgi:hypothetical protein
MRRRGVPHLLFPDISWQQQLHDRYGQEHGKVGPDVRDPVDCHAPADRIQRSDSGTVISDYR